MGRVLFLVLISGVVPAKADQPVAYSHKQHVALGLQCLDCHRSADNSAAAGIPSVRKCMLCHARMGTANPEVKKVMAYANSKREIPWQRVYGFPRESLVKFQHAPHARAKIECATCHGDMTQAAVAVRLVKHTMGSCLSCHRQYVKFGGSLMPAFRQTLTDSEIDTLIDYIAAK